MAKIKVPIYGTTGKSVALNPLATVGAQIGVDLLMPDGSIATLAKLASAVDSSSTVTSGSSSGVTAHRLLSGLTLGDDHPQYALRSILTTRGDIYVQGASGLARLAIGSNHQVLMSNGTDPAWTTLFANPTGSVGLTAVNGTANTAMRSDGAPALDQGIAPTWTAQHIFNLTPKVGAVKVVLESRQVIAGSGLTGGGALTGDVTLTLDHSVFALVAFSGAYADLTGKPTIPADVSTATYLTTANETGTLPNSREVLAGTNVAFDDTTPGQRTINVTGGGSGTVTSVTITAPAAGITQSGSPITTSGAITLALADDLAALEALSGSGIAARTGTSTWAVRTLTGTANRLAITNGSGAAGNPTFDIDAAYVGQSSITTLGTITTGIWNGTTVTVDHGGTGAVTLTGYVKGSGTAALTAAATIPYADISGTPTGAALTKVDDTNVTLSLGGAPATALLNAASLTLGWTGTLAVARGGTGAATLTGYMKGNGTSAVTANATIPYGDLTGTPTIPTAANPTASLGLAAINGSAATFMRSDGAPALDVTIAPTWTGLHTFTPGSVAAAITIVSASSTSLPGLDITNADLTKPAFIRIGRNSAVFDGYIGTAGAAGQILLASAQGDVCIRGNTASLLLGTSTAIRIKMTTAGVVTVYESTYNIAAAALMAAGTVETGTFTGTGTGLTTSPTATFTWYRSGNTVTMDMSASISGTSNATTFTITGMTAALAPVRAQRIAVMLENAGVFEMGTAAISAGSTVITLVRGTNAAFTNTGTKALVNSTLSWNVA